MEEKIKALAEFLGISEEEISEGYTDNVFETSDGEEYLVVTDEEADDEFYQYEENLIDELGLDTFSDWAKIISLKIVLILNGLRIFIMKTMNHMQTILKQNQQVVMNTKTDLKKKWQKQNVLRLKNL